MKTVNNYTVLAFFDLDGTLLNAQGKLDQEVIDALHEIRRNGILPFLATGRGHFELDEIMAQSGITGAVAMNGQYIILDGQTIYKEAIPKKSIEKLIPLAKEHDEPIALYDDGGCWVNQMNNKVVKAFAYTQAPTPPLLTDKHKNHEVNMLLVLTDQLSQVDYYKSQIPELNFFMNSPSSIDITNISTNKGTGVQHVKEVLGFTGEIYAFGDGRNDLHLFSAVDHPTAMGNALSEVKDLAEYITTANTNHGILNAFKHWGWIK